MSKNRTKLEGLMKQIGDMLGVNYRFHRSYCVCNTVMANAPRHWHFEWWKRVPGNPLNLHGWLCEKLGRTSDTNEGWVKCCNKIEENKLPTSNCHEIAMPWEVKTKDQAIEYVLFKSNFLPSTYGSRLASYDAIQIAIDLMNAKRSKSDGKEQKLH